jgi:SAM-dependent methyltransferase
MKALSSELFFRYDSSPDDEFYRQPRFVAHIDEAAIGAVTNLYREFLPPSGAILDLMSSWISHLPLEIDYSSVTGLGMNVDELEANSRLSRVVVQNLNEQPILPFENGAFDGAVCCVSVQYLTQPIEVFSEVARVLKPAAPFVVSFSNRCFPTKAVAVWQALDDAGHGALISKYFEESGGWRDIQILNRTPHPRRSDPLWAVIARRAT